MLSHEDPRRLGKVVGLDRGIGHSRIGGGRQGIFQGGHFLSLAFAVRKIRSCGADASI